MRTSKEYQQHPKRTREQAINDKYILKQQMECLVSLFAHDSNCCIYKKDDDDDSNDNEYENKTQDADADADDNDDYDDDDDGNDRKERKEYEKERQEENGKRFRRIMEDDDAYNDETVISDNG